MTMDFTLWVDRPLGGSDPLGFDAIKRDLDLVSFDSLVIYSTGEFSIDEIRIGRSYAEVTAMAAVPEPASLSMLSSAVIGVALLVRRRRRA